MAGLDEGKVNIDDGLVIPEPEMERRAANGEGVRREDIPVGPEVFGHISALQNIVIAMVYEGGRVVKSQTGEDIRVGDAMIAKGPGNSKVYLESDVSLQPKNTESRRKVVLDAFYSKLRRNFVRSDLNIVPNKDDEFENNILLGEYDDSVNLISLRQNAKDNELLLSWLNSDEAKAECIKICKTLGGYDDHDVEVKVSIDQSAGIIKCNFKVTHRPDEGKDCQ